MAIFSQKHQDLYPRQCDCNFCQDNDLIYLSDPEGKINIQITNTSTVNWQTQGSESAKFLTCQSCQTIVLVYFYEAGRFYTAVNFNLISNKSSFPIPQKIHPAQLTPSEKQRRWKTLWFNQLSFTNEDILTLLLRNTAETH